MATIRGGNYRSSIVAGDKPGNPVGPSFTRSKSLVNNPAYGMPVTGLGANVKTPKIQGRVPSSRSLVGMKLQAAAHKPAAKKTAPAAKKAVVKPAAQVVRNTVNAKPSPMMKTMPIRQGGLGVTTGKVTGTSATRLGTGGKTPMTAYQRQQQNALLKGSAFGPLGSAFSKAATSTASRSNSALGGGGGSGSAGAASGKSIADRRSSIAGGPNSTGYSNKGQPGSIR